MAEALALGHADPSSGQYSWLAPIHDLLNKTLQGELSEDEAAAALTNPAQWEDDDDLPLEDYTDLLFGVCLDKAMAIPPKHPCQERLLKVLRAIQSRPPPPGEHVDYWNSLPTFVAQLSEAFNAEGLLETTGDPLPWEKKMSVEQWRNIHSFLAAWYTSLPDEKQASFGYYHKALLLLRHVLEEPRKLEALDQNLPAVATWMSGAGSQLYENCRRNQALDPRDATRLRHASNESELYKGPDNWNEDRWDFWMGRLRELGEDENLEAEARQATQDAHRTMQQLKSQA